MHDEQGPSFLARWTRRRKAGPRVQEPADLGTAYGLEFTLEQALAIDRLRRDQPTPPIRGWLARWRAGQKPGA